jgi:hypothetical protein
MPISPSDLPWWGWIICAVVLGGVALFAYIYAEESLEGGRHAMSLSFLAGLAASLCDLIGIVRLIKWVWTS